MFVFFFKQKTAYEMRISDWSSDVCSSDLRLVDPAGQTGERDSAYLIDFDYASSPNWAVIHDLRLEHGSRTAQIDHLLINRWMDVYVLETKHFHAGIKIGRASCRERVCQ